MSWIVNRKNDLTFNILLITKKNTSLSVLINLARKQARGKATNPPSGAIKTPSQKTHIKK